MTKPIVVVDASVAAKWFFTEEHVEEALELINNSTQLIAPDLLWPEIGNVISKRLQRGEIVLAEAEKAIAGFRAVKIEFVATSNLIAPAVNLAGTTRRSVYDCIYLALAMNRLCPLITADERFFNALASTPLKKYLQLLGRNEKSAE